MSTIRDYQSKITIVVLLLVLQTISIKLGIKQNILCILIKCPDYIVLVKIVKQTVIYIA